jgi:hypothetical protein
MVRTLKDLFAGAAGGIAQVLLGEYFFPNFSIVVQSPLLQFFNLISRAFRMGRYHKYFSISRSSDRFISAQLTRGRPAIRHRESPFTDNNSILQRSRSRQNHLPKRRTPRLLQRHSHPPYRNWCLCLRAIWSFPRSSPTVRGSQCIQNTPHPRPLVCSILRCWCICRNCELRDLGPDRACQDQVADAATWCSEAVQRSLGLCP